MAANNKIADKIDIVYKFAGDLYLNGNTGLSLQITYKNNFYL